MADPERRTKQVIIIRRDLRMRRGKEIAQGSHASIAWLTERLGHPGSWTPELHIVHLTEAQRTWLSHHFTKITCHVSSEAELRDIHARAQAAGLESHLIIDAGHTEFHGVLTPTAVAVGPDWEDLIDPVTGSLELY